MIVFAHLNRLNEEGTFLLTALNNNYNWAMQRIESTLLASERIYNSFLNETNFKEVLVRSLVNDILHGNDALINAFNSKIEEE